MAEGTQGEAVGQPGLARAAKGAVEQTVTEADTEERWWQRQRRLGCDESSHSNRPLAMTQQRADLRGLRGRRGGRGGGGAWRVETGRAGPKRGESGKDRARGGARGLWQPVRACALGARPARHAHARRAWCWLRPHLPSRCVGTWQRRTNL